ncbi:MAG: MATE family efflux transporter [Blautia sp.]|nr:MATE family efflux transporter [Blautia sp.]
MGTQVITAHTASRRIYELLMMPLATIATANATFAGQNFGAKRPDRIKAAMKQVMLLELAWSVLSVLLAWTMGIPLLRLLVGEASDMVIDNAILNLRVCTVFFFPLGALLVLRNAMQPMGYKIAPVISSTIELAVKVLFCMELVPRFGYWGVVVTEPIIWVLCAVFLGIVYLISGHRGKPVKEKERIKRVKMKEAKT